jgi:hypothetical protein
LGLSYKAFTNNHFFETPDYVLMRRAEIEEDRQVAYEFLKKYAELAEKNKVVCSYREFERNKTMGGGDEDPYDRNYRELILEASSLK